MKQLVHMSQFYKIANRPELAPAKRMFLADMGVNFYALIGATDHYGPAESFASSALRRM